jgi:hypothetical protein
MMTRLTRRKLPLPLLPLPLHVTPRTLEDLGEISEVEGVVRLAGGGQQLSDDGGEHVNGRLHDGLRHGHQTA